MTDGARPEQMNTRTSRAFNWRSASIVDSGTTCVTKLVSVPSMSKKAALISVEAMNVPFMIAGDSSYIIL